MIAKRVCHIAESDFRKLNLVGKVHVLKEFEDHPYGDPTQPIAKYKKAVFVDEPLNDLLDEQRKYIKEMGWKYDTVMIALHTDPSEETIEKNYRMFKERMPDADEARLRALALDDALCDEGDYLDKFLDRRGLVTYCQCPSVKQIYSIRNYWFCDSDSEPTQVPKKETKAIYLVYLGE